MDMTVKPSYVINQGVIARNSEQTIYVTQKKNHQPRYWKRNSDGTEYQEVAKCDV